MFTISKDDILLILNDFGIFSDVITFLELQRYNYDEDDLTSKEIRLIIKVDLSDGESVVIRFKNESNVTLEIVNAQSKFAQLLADNGIKTPTLFMVNNEYAKWYSINGYNVIVTIESFVNGEIHEVTEEIAEKTGSLLAQMHNIAESNSFHVQNDVLFDPLTKNDLFSFQEFENQREIMLSIDEQLYKNIVKEYNDSFQKVCVFKNEHRYAVQGDISDCNLYQTVDGDIGVFDFNRCGDNVLYYDAIMQAIFEAKLMDYPKEIAGKQENIILNAFLRGYNKKRPFTEKQKEVFPYLYAIISSFWLGRIYFDNDSLYRSIEKKDKKAIHQLMREIYNNILSHPKMIL